MNTNELLYNGKNFLEITRSELESMDEHSELRKALTKKIECAETIYVTPLLAEAKSLGGFFFTNSDRKADFDGRKLSIQNRLKQLCAFLDCYDYDIVNIIEVLERSDPYGITNYKKQYPAAFCKKK